MLNDNKMDFTKLKSRKKTASPATPKQKKVYKEVVEEPQSKAKTNTKQGRGRRTWKNPDLKYRRIAFDTPDTSHRKLKELLATKFYDRFKYQDELINLAIDEFLEKYA